MISGFGQACLKSEILSKTGDNISTCFN